MDHFIAPPPPPPLSQRLKFLNINNGGSQKGLNPFSVFFTPTVKATVKRRRSLPVVLTLTVCTPFLSIVEDQGISK